MEEEIFTGWKEIEDFIGLKREAIIAKGFPIRKKGKTVMAMKSEILKFIFSFPVVRHKPDINAQKRK